MQMSIVEFHKPQALSLLLGVSYVIIARGNLRASFKVKMFQ
jgi:hypothetical protein